MFLVYPQMLRMQRWKAAALASVLCSSVLSIWMCRDGLLLSHRLRPALAPLRRPPRTLDARIARLAQCKPFPLPCTAAGRPGSGGVRERALGRAAPRSAPSGGASEAARACAVGDTAVRAARARGARERVRLGLRVGRDGAVPLLRRRVRSGRARLRPGPAAPPPEEASAAGTGAREPCCRPTAYEDEVSFLDTHSRYHTVHELSARECACV
ncbi:Neurturin [Camelus dromedarius]|uniref:Neurturin n=1 Tax=Camelus dromedarius TaxID=9838 RepID=A0A5N4CK00_CAMDR|nr:Neurturin [Camelus dromedarius]